jgi:hypothetical protein
LPVAAITSTRLAGVNVLADLGDNHADNPVGRRPQHGLVEPPFEHRERGRRRLDLRVRDCALLFGRGPATAASWLAYALAMSARALATSFSALVERLPRGGLAARQVLGAAELLLGVRCSRRLEPTWDRLARPLISIALGTFATGTESFMPIREARQRSAQPVPGQAGWG